MNTQDSHLDRLPVGVDVEVQLSRDGTPDGGDYVPPRPESLRIDLPLRQPQREAFLRQVIRLRSHG